MGRSLFLALLAALVTTTAAAQLPVVPGAPLTVGMRTRAAYGCAPAVPVILRVTNLNDSGAGSLRAALTDSRPRVVVFETSGYITLSSTITIGSPCVTVAGQTAPNPGVTIRGAGGTTESGVFINARDVLLQHVRIRMGSGCNSANQFYGGAQQNTVFDHMSVSWGQDDNIALNWTNGQSSDATFYRTIVAEGLYRSPGSESCTGGGTSNGHAVYFGPASGSSALVQSLFANNFERNPYMLGDTRVVLLNNVIYQWHGPWGMFFNNGGVSGGSIGGPWYASVVGNRFIAGPHSCCTGGGDDAEAYQFVYSINGVADVKGNAIYRQDNTLASPPAGIRVVEQSNQYSYDPNVSAPPSQAPLPAGWTPLPSAELETRLLPIVGARPTDRDAVDTRVIQHVKDRSGSFVSDINEVGGFPPLASTTRPFTPVSDPHGRDPRGYTRLEAQLQAMAFGLEGTKPPDPPKPGPPDVPAAAGAVFVEDSFMGTASTALTAHRGEVGATWTKQASSIDGLVLSGAGGLLNVGTGNGTLTLASGTPESAQYDVSADFYVYSGIAGHQVGIWGRAAVADPLTGVAFLYDASSATWTLSEFTAAGFLARGSCVRALAVDTTTRITLRVRDGSLHGIVGDVQCTSAPTSTAPPGLVGVSTYYPSTPDTPTTGIHVLALTATDVEAGSVIPISLFILAVIGLLSVIVVVLVVWLLRSWSGAEP
jgi:hypothetical protein